MHRHRESVADEGAPEGARSFLVSHRIHDAEFHSAIQPARCPPPSLRAPRLPRAARRRHRRQRRAARVPARPHSAPDAREAAGCSASDAVALHRRAPQPGAATASSAAVTSASGVAQCAWLNCGPAWMVIAAPGPGETPLRWLSAIQEIGSPANQSPPGSGMRLASASCASTARQGAYSICPNSLAFCSGRGTSPAASNCRLCGTGGVSSNARPEKRSPASVVTTQPSPPACTRVTLALRRTSSPWARCFGIAVIPATPQKRVSPSRLKVPSASAKPVAHGRTIPAACQASTRNRN